MDTPFVIDNGSGTIKAGWARDQWRMTCFPSIVGRPRHRPALTLIGAKDAYVGDEAQSKRGILSLTCPIQHGVVNRWDDMEKIWQYIFTYIHPEQHPVLLTESPLNLKGHREKATQLMFETFKVPALYIAADAVLSLYASGRRNGVLLDCGEGAAHVVPIQDGLMVSQAIHSFNVAGQDITNYLVKLMADKGYEISIANGVARELKEKYGYVALDFDAESEQNLKVEKSYELPDGNCITIGPERFRCTEPLFLPTLSGKEATSIQEATHNSILKCDPNHRPDLYSNIVLSGGTTMFKGFAERLQKELISLAPSSMKVEVVSPPGRKYATWAGGCILASLNSFKDIWVTKQEYEESGPGVIHRLFNSAPPFKA